MFGTIMKTKVMVTSESQITEFNFLDENKPIWRNEQFSKKIDGSVWGSRYSNLKIICGNTIGLKIFRQLRGPFDRSAPHAVIRAP